MDLGHQHALPLGSGSQAMRPNAQCSPEACLDFAADRQGEGLRLPAFPLQSYASLWKCSVLVKFIVTDIHLETVLEFFFWRQVLFSFLSAVPSRYLSFLSVDPDCYNPIQHLEMVFNT